VDVIGKDEARELADIYIYIYTGTYAADQGK
jgi:hypothetical protein